MKTIIAINEVVIIMITLASPIPPLSISLFTMSIWGYIDTNSVTALIPFFFGIILFSLGALLNKEKLVKMSAHLIVLFTLIILAIYSIVNK